MFIAVYTMLPTLKSPLFAFVLLVTRFLFCFEHLFMYLLIGEEHCCGKCVEVRGQLKGIGSTFPSVGPVAQTQIIQLGVKCLSPIEPSYSPSSNPFKVESYSPL